MNVHPKVAELGSRGALSIAVATVIGFIIKMEHTADDKIKKHYRGDEDEDPKNVVTIYQP